VCPHTHQWRRTEQHHQRHHRSGPNADGFADFQRFGFADAGSFADFQRLGFADAGAIANSQRLGFADAGALGNA
jgi:hypothetical protein